MDNYIYRLVSDTNHISKPPIFQPSYRIAYSTALFASVYAVTAETAGRITEAGTAAGFKGVVWSQRLWIDIDDNQRALEAQEWLKKEGYDHVVYTTGGRGCHIGVARSASPSHLLPQQDKLWVSTNLPGADLSLYWHLHLIRLPGTLHSSTGLPKRILYSQEGRSIDLPPFESTSPATNQINYKASEARQPFFKVWSVVQQLTPSEGQSRHKQLLQLSMALRNDAGASPEENMWMLQEVNRGFDCPKFQQELDNIVRWVYA